MNRHNQWADSTEIIEIYIDWFQYPHGVYGFDSIHYFAQAKAEVMPNYPIH